MIAPGRWSGVVDANRRAGFQNGNAVTIGARKALTGRQVLRRLMRCNDLQFFTVRSG
jgi:hypothetical protein